MRFRAKKTFFSDETQSEYVEGLGYTASEEKLLKLAERWASVGDVEVLPEPSVDGVASGSGVVSTAPTAHRAQKKSQVPQQKRLQRK